VVDDVVVELLVGVTLPPFITFAINIPDLQS
jgi:hypothetical protein